MAGHLGGQDFFAKTVSLAARIASQARGQEILGSSLLKALVESSGEFEFGGAQDVELQGLSGAHQVFTVGSKTAVIDKGMKRKRGTSCVPAA